MKSYKGFSRKKNITMSNKNKLRKKAREAREEKEAKSVFKWIIISLMILALILMTWAMSFNA